MGRNGMGKTTTVARHHGPAAAERRRDPLRRPAPCTAAPPFRIAQAGIGLVPEGRQIFPTSDGGGEPRRHGGQPQTGANAGRWSASTRFFPRLAERRRHFGDQISGGEQQMLAIGRALMTNPKLLILDEATEGLAPLIRAGDLGDGSPRSKREGLSILIIDKNVDALLRLSDRHLILEKGRRVVGNSAALAADPARATAICRFRSLPAALSARTIADGQQHGAVSTMPMKRPMKHGVDQGAPTKGIDSICPGTSSARPMCRRR